MFLMNLLTLFVSVECLTRSFIDYNTVIGNCSQERPVFGSKVTGGEVGCYEKYGMVSVMPYQRVDFFDVNRRKYFSIRFISRSLAFDGRRWKKNDLIISQHHRLMIVPKPGQLLYVRDRHDRHVFFRTFGGR